MKLMTAFFLWFCCIVIDARNEKQDLRLFLLAITEFIFARQTVLNSAFFTLSLILLNPYHSLP